jgi:hypothetical protein
MASAASGTAATTAASAPAAAPAPGTGATPQPADDADEEVYADESDPSDEQINETARKLHRYLANMENVSLKVRGLSHWGSRNARTSNGLRSKTTSIHATGSALSRK